VSILRSTDKEIAADHMGEDVRVQLRTLSSMMVELGHSWIDVLKIDVEGSEFGLLESAMDDFADSVIAGQVRGGVNVGLGGAKGWKGFKSGCLPTDHVS
jgi:hypothetical protein